MSGNNIVGFIKSNKLRSFITILIIATGITSLTGVLTAVDALKREVMSNFEKMGTGSFSIVKKRNHPSIPYHQALAFKQQLGCLQSVSIFTNLGNIPVKYGSITTTNPITNVVAADEAYLDYRNITVKEGRMFSGADIASARAVCVLGRNIAQSLLKDEVAVGKDISLAGIRYEIIGTLATGGEIIIPVSNARLHFTSESTSFSIGVCSGNIAQQSIVYQGIAQQSIAYQSVEAQGVSAQGVEAQGVSAQSISSQSVAPKHVDKRRDHKQPNMLPRVMPPRVGNVQVIDNEEVYDVAESVFRAIRRLSPTDVTDFSISRSDAMLARLSKITGIITSVAAITGLITLLVAAIGLMNIMLVSVKERTREIGIRKAVGASAAKIRRQFLLESIIISEMGCIAGTVTGILAGNAVAMLLGAPFIIPWEWIMFAVVMCLAVGVASGYLPAAKAAALDPVEALRCE